MARGADRKRAMYRVLKWGSRPGREAMRAWRTALVAALVLSVVRATVVQDGRRVRSLFTVDTSNEVFATAVRSVVLDEDIVKETGSEMGVILDRERLEILKSGTSEADFRRFVSVAQKNVDRQLDESPRQRSVKAASDDDFYEGFRPYEDIIARMRYIADSYPSARYESIGSTYEGRDIGALFIGGSSPKRSFIVTGGVHAREWISPAAVLYTAEKAAKSIDEDADFQVIIVPLVNPDGYAYTITERLWRKNRNSANGEHCIGVDINRNFGTGYGTEGSGASAMHCSSSYHGEEAFSEKETQAVRALVMRVGTDTIVGHTDIHAFGSLVLAPWFHSRETSSAVKEAEEIAKSVAESMTNVNRKEFAYGQGSRKLYVANGAMSDWFFGRHTSSLTIEMREGSSGDKWTGFLVSEKDILYSSEEACTGVSTMMQTTGLHDFNCRNKRSRRYLSVGAWVGIVIGSLVGFALIILVVMYIFF